MEDFVKHPMRLAYYTSEKSTCMTGVVQIESFFQKDELTAYAYCTDGSKLVLWNNNDFVPENSAFPSPEPYFDKPNEFTRMCRRVAIDLATNGCAVIYADYHKWES